MHCKNCHNKLDQTNNYCNSCGAKIITQRVTLAGVSKDIGEQVFNYDNKLLKTFWHLFTRPENVIGGYINGLRKRYINVIQYFLISLTITGLHFFILGTLNENPFELDPELFGVGTQNVKNPETVTKYLESTSDILTNYYSFIYVISIPISAFTTWFSYRIYNRSYNYVEHIIINTYYSAQILIISAFLSVSVVLFGLHYIVFSFMIMIFGFGYLWFLLKRIYKLNLLNSIAYFLIFCFFYALIFILLIFIGSFITVMTSLA